MLQPNNIIDRPVRPDNEILALFSSRFDLILERLISGRKVQEFMRTISEAPMKSQDEAPASERRSVGVRPSLGAKLLKQLK